MGVWRGQSRDFEQTEVYIVWFAIKLGLRYIDLRKLIKADSLLQRGLTGYKKAFEEDYIITLTAVHGLGNLYSIQGKLTIARSIYQWALLGYARDPDADPMLQLILLYNMGLLYRVTEKSESAKDHFSQAFERHEKLLGPQHADTVDALKQLNLQIERNVKGGKN